MLDDEPGIKNIIMYIYYKKNHRGGGVLKQKLLGMVHVIVPNFFLF